MKRLQKNFSTNDRSSFPLPTIFISAVALSAAFWLFAGSTGTAGVNECTFCHKRTSTMTLACNSLEYQRHLDHGDTMGACAASRIAIDPEKVKASSDDRK